jgi:hypothetical protein
MWQAILRHYDTHHRPRVEQERRWFASSTSLEEAIKRATLAVDHRGKRFHHQRRIPPKALDEASATLLNATDQIGNAFDFDDLIEIVTRLIADVRRTGELYRYDSSLRIGYYLNILPTKVYLHAGTRTGARALGFGPKIKSLEPYGLPLELRDRPAHEVEDILCIYKDRLSQVPCDIP